MKNLIIITLLLSIFGCASDKPKGKTAAEVLFKEANTLVKEERYLLAIEKINQIKNQYPYSYYATPAELLQADIFYLQESYVEAAAAYILFRDFHPKHEQRAYVVFRIAESYYKQLPDTDDRDLEAAHEAIKYYNEIITSYSSSPYIKDARSKIRKCRKRIRNYEKYVADFYFKTEEYKAARWRYNDILENFKDNKLRSHAMEHIVLSTYYLKEYEKCISLSDKYNFELLAEDKKEVEQFTKYCKNKIN